MPSPEPSEPARKRVRFNAEGKSEMDGVADAPKRPALLAKDVVQLRFVNSKADVGARGASGDHASDLTFQPSYLHQIIPNETVHGYEQATVAVYVHLGSLTYWIDSVEKVFADDDANNSGSDEEAMEMTDVEGLLTPFIKAGLTSTRTQFLSAVQSQPHMPVAHRISKYKHANEWFAIYKERLFVMDKKTGGMVKNEAFHDFHRRMSFLMFVHVEGASFIDDDDPRWEIFVVVKLEEDEPVSFVGYATTYPFAVMQRTEDCNVTFVDRIRISQVAIVPSEWRKGHGGRLIHAIYEDAHSRNAMEVTVEDPNRSFRVLRDISDLTWAYRTGVLPPHSAISYDDEVNLKRELHSKVLITLVQARRCLEVHQLRFVDRNDEHVYKPYRLWVKRRLFTDFVDALERFEAAERKEKLSQLYEETENEYLTSARRVTKSM